MNHRSRLLAVAVLVLGVPLGASLALERAAGAKGSGLIRFFDAPSQSAEFIGYSRSIALTPEQKAIRDKALSSMPAACCDKFSQSTCCCPCNLAKTVWGLSNYLIARKNASAAQVQASVHDWLQFVNPKGFSGDICDSPGGCGKNFGNDGCGGMDERNLLNAR